ncbi:hypothetical protein JG688_00011944, partial [Phytophthora aleatoria]
ARRPLVSYRSRELSGIGRQGGWLCVTACVVGALDGSLIEIERPEKFDGFYCRKCYPALNVQEIVSGDILLLSVEVRPGSWSDRKCWLYSAIGRTLYNVIPPGTHFIGDAGYALLPGLMVPYRE